MFHDDTIVAISSAAAPGARIVLRISGPEAASLAEGLGAGAGAVVRGTLRFCDLACPAWVYRFVHPHSYTGQDLVEFHLPGNPLLARLLVDWLVGRGARLAEAGEFTARAYFNGKLDLAQAEGVAATIAAQNGQQLAAARQLMAGELARRLEPVMERLAQMLALVEADIDFSEEGIQFLSAEQAIERIGTVRAELQSLVAQSATFQKLSHEPTIVLAGRPNAGKSTLANALAGQERAVVSAQAGTTRDVLSVEIVLRRGIARLVDIAGLYDSSEIAEESSPEEIQRQMRERAGRAIEESDVLVLVREATDGRAELVLPRAADLVVVSKIDLLPAGVSPPGSAIAVSAAAGVNLEGLRAELDRLAFGSEATGVALALTARHLQAIDDAGAALDRALDHVEAGSELLAAELRRGLDALGQIRGLVTPDDILGKIFSSFCIGK